MRSVTFWHTGAIMAGCHSRCHHQRIRLRAGLESGFTGFLTNEFNFTEWILDDPNSVQ